MDGEHLQALVARDQVRAVAVYDWFLAGYGDLPEGWVRVAEWQTIRNVAISGDRVVFFAPTIEAIEPLRSALRRFESRMPTSARLIPRSIGPGAQSRLPR
jgi:hypothetical protein